MENCTGGNANFFHPVLHCHFQNPMSQHPCCRKKAWMPCVPSRAGEGHCSDVGASIREGSVEYSMILELTFRGWPWDAFQFRRSFCKHETTLSHKFLWPCTWASLIAVPVAMCWQQGWEKVNEQRLVLVGLWLCFPGSSYDPSGGAKHKQSVLLGILFRDV